VTKVVGVFVRFRAPKKSNYTVEVITTLGCRRSRKIKVTASIFTASQPLIIAADLTDINTVTVNVSGKGKYEFSLNEPSALAII
jgi:hypothetical protein